MMFALNMLINLWIGLTVCTTLVFGTYELTVQMPNVHPDKNDQYLSTTQPVWNNGTYYITSFEPLASMDSVHHMLVYGCRIAIELRAGSARCITQQVLLYAWARNAPKLDLPEGVGFKVGWESDIRHILLQVHYADVSKLQGGDGDQSGVKFYLTSDKLPKRAGIFLLATGGQINAGSTEYFEAACKYDDDNDIHPFAYRTHTHHHGLFVSGYRVQNTESGIQDWKVIGKKNPLLPQFFYPVEDDLLVIKQDDVLAARCTMQNNETRTVHIGGTSKDEMCNFYIMYYVDGDQLIKVSNCWSEGPPYYHWATDDNLNNLPQDASGP